MRKYSIFATDWGKVAAVWSADGLWALSFPRASAEEALASLKTDMAGAAEAYPAWADALDRELKRYFAGEKLDFTVPVDWGGYTPFQAAVLRHTAAIPYGVVEGYGQVAKAVGSPKAARAVGGALHINRTPVVVPCHRVVGANGALVGFGGGLDRKKALLDLESVTYLDR
ncbi:methylated-DNA--[protein]-cysteine S-methyltransferase [Anaeroselena agilis]|uniref:Methylated-DNA--[protein]-cysteine S-methyltransferase n=1 Tax=Anaeroselena agilis TaxID=3063788 RepID=A0ABU3P4R9_9FIRM|nr:methylated-DNA--[protein]-cysteine S-methyltransferase [Selenomonadales bacterium 4137-cl]